MTHVFRASFAVVFVFGFYSTHGLPTDVICGLPKVIGDCKAAAPRFFYNTTTEKCEKFTYGGCDGNKNNFVTEKECKDTCVKKTPLHVCEMPKCMPGCDMLTLENEECPKCVCSRRKACFEAIDVGSCNENITRYFFVPLLNKCQNFTYGGCDGNGNNFLTPEECESTCVKFSRPPEPECPMVKCPGNCPVRKDDLGCNTCDCPRKALCYLPMDAGSSDANITRYYFDSTKKACKPFQYNGADGNDNNFETKSKCRHTCTKRKPKYIPDSAEAVEECKTECPQDCGKVILDNGCVECPCSEPFFPVYPTPNAVTVDD